MNKVINCKGLYYRYKEASGESVEIIKDLDFELSQGESVAILGSSGCGKSTFLNLLGGLDYADEGSIVINGHKIDAKDDNHNTKVRGENIGFIYQFHHLLQDFTAQENVSIPLYISNINKVTQKAVNILKLVGLENRKGHFPSELSGGEKQRVAIARAMVLEPKCILADEPTGSLDKKTAKEVMNLLINLQKTKLTSLIIVTHDHEVASRMDKIYEMKEGKLQKIR